MKKKKDNNKKKIINQNKFYEKNHRLILEIYKKEQDLIREQRDISYPNQPVYYLSLNDLGL